MVINYQADIGPARNWQNGFSHATNFTERRVFGAQLNQVRAAITKLLSKKFRRASVQICRVNERVEFALAEGFHGLAAQLWTAAGSEAPRRYFESWNEMRHRMQKRCRRFALPPQSK